VAVLYCCVGALFAGALAWLGRPDQPQRTRFGAAGRSGLARALLALLALYLLLHPLTYLQSSYARSIQNGWTNPSSTNVAFLQTVDLIKANRLNGESVILDLALDDVKLGTAGLAGPAFLLALGLDNVHTRPMRMGGQVLDSHSRCRDQLVIVASLEPEAEQELIAQLRLRELDH